MRILYALMLGAAALMLTACGSGMESSIALAELPEGDAERGAVLYDNPGNGTPPCSSCHLEDAAGAPSLDNYAEVAGTRVSGESAEVYTFYAITAPGRFIVEGYGNAMYNQYDEKLLPQDIADLTAYLLEPAPAPAE